MLQSLLDRAKRQLEESLPFVLYHKPGAFVLKALFQQDDTLHTVTDYTETGFVFAPFLADEAPILLRPTEVVTATLDKEVVNAEPVNREMEMDAEEAKRYKTLLAKAILEIQSGRCEKIVLSRQIAIKNSKPGLALFVQLLEAYPQAFCYLWYHPKVGMWLGATPEILMKAKGVEFTTMSLAGTQVQKADDGQPAWSNKEFNEQQLVTDYIKTVLEGRVTQVRFSQPETVRAGHLWHLRTKITGRFGNGRLKELVTALHPTPAVCGLPLQAARRFILENEEYDRSFYTGFLGELNFKTDRLRNGNKKNQENSAYRSVTTASELFVNLRCMQLVKDKALIYVGGGITIDSDVEKEWMETQSKAQTMLRILAT